jgi:hypothetical protein
VALNNGDQCVLLVSPNGNYAEVLGKQGDKITARFGCGREQETTLAEFEQIGAKPVRASRWCVGEGYTYLADGPTFWDIDVYCGGQRHEIREKKR